MAFLWQRGFGKGGRSRGFPEAEGEDYRLHWFELRFLMLTGPCNVSLVPNCDLDEVRLPTTAALQYDTYSFLRSEGLFPRSGLAFGADFVVYSTPTPESSHSEYLALCIDVQKATPAIVTAHVRNANSYAKAALVCYRLRDRLVCRVVSALRI